MKKRMLLIVLSVVLVSAAAVGATLAYFSATATANNTFTVGNVQITLTEPKWVSEGSVDAKTVYPGEPLAKDPTITNVGANPCVVRIKIEWPKLPTGVDPITFRTDYVNGKLGDNWYYCDDDGYYYYLKPLKNPADTDHPLLSVSTDALFDQVVMPTNLTNDLATSGYTIKVTAQAMQAQGIFSKFADMADGISQTTAPANSSTIEFELVKQMFSHAF